MQTREGVIVSTYSSGLVGRGWRFLIVDFGLCSAADRLARRVWNWR